MKPVLAIAWMAVRSAVRSRVVGVLLGLLFLAIIGLPLTVKSDGTLAGEVQVRLTYTLGAVLIILSIATWWAGCAAVSSEVQAKQIQLVLTKPVGRGAVWLGKWLGLVALNAALLAVSGAAIYGMIRWKMDPDRLTEAQRRELREQILVARWSVGPQPLDVTAEARRIFEEQQQAGALPANQPVEQVVRAIEESLVRAAHTVPPGYKRTWVFELPATPVGERPVVLRYKFSSSEVTKGTLVRGLWLVGPVGKADRFELEQVNATDGAHAVAIPVSAFGGSRQVAVEYANINPLPVAVLFEPKGGIELQPYAGSFEGNLARALMLAWVQLAFVGAVAVAAGTLLSLPVAALVTGYILLLVKAGDYVAMLATERGTFFSGATQGQPGESALDWVLRQVLWVEGALVQPLQGPNVLEYLTAGRALEWSAVAGAFLIKVVIYSGMCAAVTTFLFNRREIALPME